MQVLWLGKEDVNVTWEPASSLPQAVVECTAVQQNSDFYGQKTCTLHIETKTLQSSASKRPRTDRPVIQSNEGWVPLIPITVPTRTYAPSFCRLDLATSMGGLIIE